MYHFYFQVGEANIKAAASERSLAEANLKIDGLVTEVAGFKDMVLTSTPSKPNRHLHPQISGDKKLAAAKRAGKRNICITGQLISDFNFQKINKNFFVKFLP